MADSVAVTCECCLKPYTLDTLILVFVGGDIQGQGRTASLCLSCATEIAAALAATLEAKAKEANKE